jgi:hypothetical protein
MIFSLYIYKIWRAGKFGVCGTFRATCPEIQETTMKANASSVSDYDLVRKMLSRLIQLEQSRRVTAKEVDMIQTVRTRWTNDGEAFALGQAPRDNLVALVRTLETRLKTPPYPRFY